MNNQFSLSRFGNLFRKHTAEYYKIYIMSITAIIGILIIIINYLDFMRREPMTPEMQFTVFIYLFLVAGTIYTSTIFSDLGEQRSAIASLTLPASSFEKYLVKWVYTYVLFQVIFISLFLLVSEPLQSLFQIGHDKKVVNFLFYEPNFGNIILPYTILHSIALWCAVFFKKLHFVKSVFIGLLIMVVSIIANRQIMENMLGRKNLNAVPFMNVIYIDNNKVITFGIEDQSNNVLFQILLVVIAFIIWAAAYFRLKEKQV